MLLWQLALGIGVLLLWQGASGRLIDNFFISNPLDVGTRLYRWIADGSIFQHIAATLYATGMGFLIGSVGGAILGVWLGVSPFASRLLNPYLNALNALPKVALAPLFVCGSGSASSRRSRSPPCWCSFSCSSTRSQACARSIRT
jgi:NitT/TauT family transport system permease protein